MTNDPGRTPVLLPPTPKGRRTRAKLLLAARAVFARSGYVECRMVDIAEEADVSLGALYRYFQDKEAIFHELLAGLHDELIASSRARGIKLRDNPYEAINAANAGFLSRYQRNADIMRVLVEASAVDSNFRDIWWGMRQKFVSRFVDALMQAKLAPGNNRSQTTATVEALCFMVEQWAYVWLAHEQVKDIEDGARILTDIWYHSIFGSATELEAPAK